MIGVSCKFDPLRDIKEVEQGLAVNLTDALRTGIVHETGENLSDNGIDDPGRVIGVIRDKFDAIDAARAIRKYGKKANVSPTSNEPAQASNAPAAGNASAE